MMLKTIMQAAQNAQSATNPVQIMEAVVVTAPPEISIKLKNNDKLVIPKELIVVAEYLTNHKRTVAVTASGTASMSSSSVEDVIVIDEEAIPLEVLPEHDIMSLSLTSSDFAITEGEIEFLDELKAGDAVMVASFQGGQKFYIFDRIVTY